MINGNLENPRCIHCNEELVHCGEETFQFGDEVETLPVWECMDQNCRDQEAIESILEGEEYNE